MIIGTLAILMLLFGGGGLEFYLTNLKDSVKEYVVEEARRDAVLDASKQLGKDLKDLEKDVDAIFKEFVELHEAYTSTAAEFDANTAELTEMQGEVADKVLAARKIMREQMTESEWTAVFSLEEK